MSAKRKASAGDGPPSPSRRRKRVQEVSWSDIDDNIIRQLIDLAEHFDGAVRFGRSRDRSVFSIGFYIGEERFTEWIPGGDETVVDFDRIIAEIHEDYERDSPDD